MAHPGVHELLAGGEAAQAHLSRCESCRQLSAILASGALEQAAPGHLVDLPELPLVESGNYAEWTELAARGGMGRIFRARDRRLGRVVAIKLPRDAGGGGPARAALLRRFEREARLTARLQHPSIVGVYEAGRFADGQRFYAMPLLRGVPLSQEIDKRKGLAGRLGLLPHLTAVAEAVAYAHQQGIVHRDLKPDNVLVGAFGETVLVDWGLAKDLAEKDGAPAPEADAPIDGLTVLGIGTPQYMPPEQARGDEPDERVDIYALGATLYHLLSGSPPYGSGSSAAIRRKLEQGPPPPLEELAPETPPELVDIVARAMDRDPLARYPAAQDLADELRRFQTGQLLRSRRYTAVELLRHFARRHRTSLRIAAGFVILLAALAVVAFVRIARERDRARESQRAAERELRRAQGVVASRLSPDPAQRLDAVLLGLRAVGPELRAGKPPVPEALQGLLDALAAGPALRPLRHQGAIKCFDRSPDGAKLAAVDDARTVVLFDRGGGALASFATAIPEPERVRFSPDGARLVVCGNDPLLEVFDVATGRSRSLETRAQVVGCGFLPDGGLIAAAEEVAVRDPATLAVRRRLPLASPATSLAVASDGAVAVSSLDGALALWLPSGEVRPLAPPGSAAGSLLFARGRRLLVQAGADQVVRAFPLDGGAFPAPRVLHREQHARLGRLDQAPDGSALAAGAFDADGVLHTTLLRLDGAEAAALPAAGAVIAWTADPRWYVADLHGPLALADAGSGRPVLVLAAHADEVNALWSDGLLATAARDGRAFLWDLAAGSETGLLLGHTAEVVAALPAPGGSGLLTASLDGSARIWRSGDGSARTVESGAEILAAAWAPGGAEVYTGDLSGTVRRFDAAGGQALGARAGGGPVSCLAVGSAGRRVLVGRLDGTLELLGPGLEPLRLLAGDGSAITAAALSPDGLRAASAHADGTTRLYDVESGAELARLADPEPSDEPGDHDGHAALAFASGGRLLAGRPAGRTLVLDASTLAVRGALDGRLAAGPGAALLPGGAVVTTAGSGDLLVHRDGSPPLRLAGHTLPVLAAALSPDGARLASAGLDGSVRVWDPVAGRLLATLSAAGLGAATAVALLEGGRVAAGYASGAVRLFPATPEAAVEQACAILRRFGRDGEAAAECR